MTTPCRLVGLGAAIICLTPRIKTVESLFSCPTRSCFGFNTCNHDSPVSSKPRPRCRRLGSLVRARSGSFTAVDNPTYGKEADGSTPRESREGRDGDGGEEQAASELGPTSAPQGIVRPKPAWVEDPSESRVKGWIRAAARRRDHERVVMYLHRYREGLARKEESVGIEVYNTVLRALEECERWKLALGVLRGMQTDRVAPDRNSYFFVISACSRRGEASTAVELVGEMQRGQAGGGPVPDLLLFSVAIKACAYGRRWQQAVRLLGDMESAGVQPNLVVVNTVLTACARCGQTLRATEILKRMKATHGIDPDARSYNSVINGHERAGEWREALSLAQIMERAEGVTPTVVTFNSVIGACKRAKKPTEALAVLGLMRRKGLKPDVISYNSAISACSSGGMWKPALQLLEIMPTEGVQPDLTTYNAALDVCAKSGQWEMALSLFEELSRSEDPVLVPDLYTYNTVMTVFSRSGMLRRGLELLERMKASGLSPDVVTYRLTGIALLSALSLSPSRGVASPTWRRAPETRGVLCARVELVDSTLVRACERALPPQPEVALRLVSEMDAEDVAPNNTTFVSVALSFGRAGRPLESLDVLETMRQRGSPPDAICCQTVLRVLDRWNKPAEALGLFEYMGHHGLLEVPEVTEAAYCCGIRALEKLGRWREAVSLLERWRKLDHASDNGSDPGKDAKYDQWYRALSILASGGLPPDTDVRTARAAMVAAASGGLAEEALAIMRNMEDIGFELGAVEYGAAMEAFEQSRKPERSLEIFDDMLANNVEPDVLCFASATRCLRVSGDWETAVRLVVTALSQGLLPNSRTFETLARLCSQSGRYRELWGVKDYMRDLVSQGGLARPGSSLYISLIRVCGAARRPDLVLRCLSEMSADQAPGKDWRTRALDDPSTLSAAIGALSACNRTAEADIIFNRAIEQGILPDATSGGTWAAAEARARAAQHTGADGKAAGESKGLDEDENTGEPDSKKVLWVDIRRAPVEIVSAIVRRAVRALRVVGSVSDGVVVEWGGGRWTEGDEWDALLDSSTGGDRGSRSAPSGRSASRAGRRDGVLEAFARIEPRLTVTEPKGCRGQVHVEKEELRRWLRESQKRRRRRRKEREG